ncbi:ATP-binding protein [Microbacterium murale]|uniref:ATP-binding protein n=1 Tax=Microbacterium murale TaxID=1081040 RepID=A0ABQ1RYU0_9MICO|nr:ATP-binding protein [Microbacterium murale]
MTRQRIDFEPGGLSGKERRQGRRERASDQRHHDAPRTQPRERALPEPAVSGPFGPGLAESGYWNLAPVNVPPHQATSQHVAGIYPFVADAGLGHRGPILGVDLNADALWHFSPWETYADSTDRGSFSTNVLVLGAYRAGKSAVIKTLVSRSMAFGHQAVVPSDPKGEWRAVAEAIPGGNVIRLGGAFDTRLNPLDRGPRRTGVSDEQHEQMVKQRRITVLTSLVQAALPGAHLSAVEHAALLEALERCITHTGDRPTLRTVFTELSQITSETDRDRHLAHGAIQPSFVLRRFVNGDLSGLFEDHSTVSFDDDAPIVVVDTSELFARGDLVAQLSQICTTAWNQAVISDRDAHKTRYVIREEGWRDMTSLASLQMYQQWLKLSRHYGISNIVILHKMGDLDAVGEADSQERNLAYSIAGDIENKFIFRINQQESASIQQRLNVPPAHADMARQLRKGEFLAYVGQYSYLVDAFATSTDWEYELFKTDDAMELPGGSPGELQYFEPHDLDSVWPVDSDVDGWLTSSKELK